MENKEVVKSSIDQLDRISKQLGSLGESKDYTEVAISALEKQIPVQVKYVVGACGEKYECPECGSSLTDTDLFAGHCKWCGQSVEDN